MPNLSHLKIASAPGAFAEWAQKHNELVRLLEGIEASTGIDIKVVSNPPKRLAVPGTPVAGIRQPAGRIIIGMRSTQFPAGYGPGFGGTTNAGTGTVNVVGSDGYLVPVIANGNATNTSPTAGSWITGSGNVTVTNTGLVVTANGNSVTVAFANITRAMSIKTISVCDNGNTKSLDIIASNPY